MINEGLILGAWRKRRGDGTMTRELMLVALMMGIGLCVAGAGTHLYQGVLRQQAMLRYDGKTFLNSMGNLAMSFICGPYIMLQMGWTDEQQTSVKVGSALVAALVAFGWSLVTGMLFVGIYVLLLR